ncbi:MAG: penicillin-binding protein 1C [Chthoniobacter sp.]|uniref:penicillin-binding protein 1C n=1 Tax=Chthoniobacter sp. TaxID=2510640 RepID=UPI0032A1C8F1
MDTNKDSAARTPTTSARWPRTTRFLKRAAWWGLRGGVAGVALGWVGLKFVPLPPALLRPSAQSVEFTDRYGKPLRETRTDQSFAHAVELREVPPNVIHAMLAAEDKRFFEHRGVDVVALARAVVGNLRHRRVTSGASTITQQLVKISDTRPRSFTTKVLEAARALRLEQLWSKDEILAAYLNRLDFGNMNVGVVAAADYYFGKPLADLSDAEAAFLAGLPKNPTRMNPHRNFARAKRRQMTVLQRMRDDGLLTADELATASQEKLTLQARQRRFLAPHFVDFVLQELPPGAPPVVATTLDLDLNRFVEDTVKTRLAQLREKNVRNGSVVVIDNRTGEVIALVGSENYFAPGTGQVNGALARRSAGSTFKAFTYLLALERGATPASVVADVPAVFMTSTGGYHPENYNKRCYGPMRYRLALANSLNIPAVRVLSSIGGASTLQARLRAWGMTTLDQPADFYGLGLTIGNAETRLIELTNAYAALARLGEWRPYRVVLDPALAKEPDIAKTTSAADHSAQTRAAAWLIADILSDNAARVPAFGANSALRFDFPVACKTGTSTDYRDNWAMGYTPEFTVGVWVGNFDGAPMRDVSGVTGAGPIMHAVMAQLHARFGTTWFAIPEDIVEREVHPLTGKLLVHPRADAVRESFLQNNLPPVESADDYDADGRVKLGPEYRAWMESGETGAATRALCDAKDTTLRLEAPVAGTTYVIDPDLPSSRWVPVQASGAALAVWESESLHFRERDGRTYVEAREGVHRLSVRDPATGARAETWIRVKTL